MLPAVLLKHAKSFLEIYMAIWLQFVEILPYTTATALRLITETKAKTCSCRVDILLTFCKIYQNILQDMNTWYERKTGRVHA